MTDHSQEPEGLLPVEQVDREAAISLYTLWGYDETCAVIGQRLGDKDDIVQAFARHRLSALPPQPNTEGWLPPGAKILDHKWLDPQCIETGCRSLNLSNALRAYLSAQRRMLDRWADGDVLVKNELWRALHACEVAAVAALAPPEEGA